MTEAVLPSDATQNLLSAVDSLGPLIEKHAADAEANRQLSSAVYDAMYHAGLFAMLAPKARGGIELHPVGCMRVWEAIARFDASAAWNVYIWAGSGVFADYLSEETARELLGAGQDRVIGGSFALGQARPVDGGFALKVVVTP